MKRLCLLAAVVFVAGCTAPRARVELQQVNVAVPVECKEPVPARPAMPTEALRLGVTVDDFVRAALAELERREGYEGELLTALENCRTPIKPRRPDAGMQ
ncbi:hypothetical protein [Variovorax sp. PMC12]|uniref:hypothetical protein n=1 Tax=Variovorax sp. PMC12 TaxID=2126319 RepID=UPI000D11D9F5|nr:hypothetical protein [Variovorax sp. PMC12]AVQ84304.1 hypothetical protein C4F17_27025 [Variovorax sp. PMC12]